MRLRPVRTSCAEGRATQRESHAAAHGVHAQTGASRQLPLPVAACTQHFWAAQAPLRRPGCQSLLALLCDDSGDAASVQPPAGSLEALQDKQAHDASQQQQLRVWALATVAAAALLDCPGTRLPASQVGHIADSCGVSSVHIHTSISCLQFVCVAVSQQEIDAACLTARASQGGCLLSDLPFSEFNVL
jgi:hypothetical protein